MRPYACCVRSQHRWVRVPCREAVFFHSFRTGSASGDTARAAGHAFALTSLTSFAIAALAAVLVFLLPKVATARA